MENSTPTVNFDELLNRLAQAIEQSDATAAVQALQLAEVDDTAKLVDRLDADLRKALFNLLSPEQAAIVGQRDAIACAENEGHRL